MLIIAVSLVSSAGGAVNAQDACDPGIFVLGDIPASQVSQSGTVFGHAVDLGKVNFAVITCFNGVEEWYFGWSPGFDTGG